MQSEKQFFASVAVSYHIFINLVQLLRFLFSVQV